MPHKIWTQSELVTAADQNTYLQEQVIGTFADAIERDAAIALPTDGQMAFLTDTRTLTMYRGSAWEDYVGGTPEEFIHPFTATVWAGTLTVRATPSLVEATVSAAWTGAGSWPYSEDSVPSGTIPAWMRPIGNKSAYHPIADTSLPAYHDGLASLLIRNDGSVRCGAWTNDQTALPASTDLRAEFAYIPQLASRP